MRRGAPLIGGDLRVRSPDPLTAPRAARHLDSVFGDLGTGQRPKLRTPRPLRARRLQGGAAARADRLRHRYGHGRLRQLTRLRRRAVGKAPLARPPARLLRILLALPFREGRRLALAGTLQTLDLGQKLYDLALQDLDALDQRFATQPVQIGGQLAHGRAYARSMRARSVACARQPSRRSRNWDANQLPHTTQ